MSRRGDVRGKAERHRSRFLDELERRQGTRALAKRLLIVCEDGVSAPRYFQALKRHLKLSAASIEVVAGDTRTQPIQVVERAIERSQAARHRNSGTEPFEGVWCVIDGDFGDEIANARAKAVAKGVGIAVSMPCFEQWVLLHFQESDKPFALCDRVVAKVRKWIPGYEKGKKFDFADVVRDFKKACERARAQRKGRHGFPESQNPCSEVYRLIDSIEAGLIE